MTATPSGTSIFLGNRRGLALFCVAATVGLASSCASSELSNQAQSCNMPAIEAQRALQPVPLPDGGYPPVNEVPFNSISMLDGTITHKIYVRDATVRRSPGGRVEVRSQVANCTDFPQQVEMRIQFYDGDRMASEPVSAWKRVFLSPRSNGAFAETSIGTRTVQYYVIEVREGR